MTKLKPVTAGELLREEFYPNGDHAVSSTVRSACWRGISVIVAGDLCRDRRHRSSALSLFHSLERILAARPGGA